MDKFIIIIFCLILLLGIYFLFYNYLFDFSENDKNIYLNGINIIYWINLDKDIKRKKRMEEMFKDNVFKNIKIERISAVDGKSSNINNIINKNFKYYNKKYSKVEHACLLSHLNTIRLFNASNNDISLIMEDDMTLEYKLYWQETIKDIIKNAPKDWEIILLCYINYNGILNKKYTKNGKNNKMVYSTGAYLINKKGANKINNLYINNKYELNNNYPVEADGYLFTELNTYTYKYPYFIYPNDNDSSIHPEHISAHNKSKKIIDKELYKIK